MHNWLVKKFIKDYENTGDLNVRAAYGKLSGKVGIFCNAFLFLGKFIVGTVSGSVSITADAVNNLSDAASSIISLIGFKMAEKPADADHPYGHARYEYLSGLTVAVMIILIGVELFKSSLDKVLNPSPVDFSAAAAVVLIGSIIVKLWMSLFNRALGKKINSATLEATSADSRNDVISTSAVLIAALITHFAKIDLDGYMGVAVAVFILYSGIGLVKDTLDPLLGSAPDPALVDHIQKKILSYDGVLGTHDLMIHDYGPGRKFASVHVEMAAEEDVMKSHDIIDNIERQVLEEDGIHLVIHLDPISDDDEEISNHREMALKTVQTIDPRLTIHDFRMVKGDDHTNLIFDVVMPPEFGMKPDQLKKEIADRMRAEDPNHFAVVTVDYSYTRHPAKNL